MSVSQYLVNYAEPETEASRLIRKTYQHVLCIPAFAESIKFLDQFSKIFVQDSLLIILVINVPDKCESEKLEKTRNLLLKIKSRLHIYEENKNSTFLQVSETADLLLIDRCSEGYAIPKEQGVGLARKIACDIATKLISDELVLSHWIHSSDADSNFPLTYFSESNKPDSTIFAAATYNFKHQPHNDRQTRVCQSLYDLSLHYYVQGLLFAGSPYAFHTIGSTLVFNYQHYAKVRGFPKRNAAEDFYILNKLAKTGKIAHISDTTVEIETRLSDRVPFGTGPALYSIMNLDKPEQDYFFYNPEVFICLKTVIDSFFQMWENKALPEFTDLIVQCLNALNIDEGLNHAMKQSKDLSSFKKHMHNWFDGFKTLKFIHLLRDNGLPSLPKQNIENSSIIFNKAKKRLEQS